MTSRRISGSPERDCASGYKTPANFSTSLENTFVGINETLAANREEMKNLAYKTQNEVESGTFAPGEDE